MRAVLDPDFKGFQWDEAKAASNELKHGITFEEAAEALAHPHLHIESGRYARSASWRSACHRSE